MKNYKAILKEIEVIDYTTCDSCGKVCESNHSVQMINNSSDWGNDSSSSFQEKDYCSLECYKQLAIEFLKDSAYFGDSEFDDISREKLQRLIYIN